VADPLLTNARIAQRLRDLLGSVPHVDASPVLSRELSAWSGQCAAVMAQYAAAAARIDTFGTNSIGLQLPSTRDMSVNAMLVAMEAALATVELRLAPEPGERGVFATGDAHGFHQALVDWIDRAQRSLLLVDPFADEKIVDGYLKGMRKKIPVRLLMAHNKPKCQARLVEALAHAIPQFDLSVEVRASKETHDRLALRDDTDECVLIGSSINSPPGKRSPSYLAPLDADLAALKREIYERIWNHATRITVTEAPP